MYASFIQLFRQPESTWNVVERDVISIPSVGDLVIHLQKPLGPETVCFGYFLYDLSQKIFSTSSLQQIKGVCNKADMYTAYLIGKNN